MGKRDLSEEDIKARYITPAVEQSGWDKKQIRYEYAFTAGRIILRGNITKRSKKKFTDYLLFYKPNLPLAIIEGSAHKDKKIKKSKPLPEITEEEIPFEIPESWEWVRVGEIGSLTRGSGIKRTERKLYLLSQHLRVWMIENLMR